MTNQPNNDQVIRDAQYRKGLSIAYFNATNAAIELAKHATGTKEEILALVKEYRDFFIEEHKNYYANVMAHVGPVAKPEEAVKLITACENMESLRKVWRSFSEDERHDPRVIQAKDEIKKKYEAA